MTWTKEDSRQMADAAVRDEELEVHVPASVLVECLVAMQAMEYSRFAREEDRVNWTRAQRILREAIKKGLAL